MSKTTNRFSPEVRARAVRLVLEHEAEHASRWAAVVSVAGKIGCSAQTLNEWVKKAEIDSGRRGGVPTEVAETLKALERENRELPPKRMTSCARPQLILRRRSSTAAGDDDGVYRRPSCDLWGRADLPGAADRPIDISRAGRATPRPRPQICAGAAR